MGKTKSGEDDPERSNGGDDPYGLDKACQNEMDHRIVKAGVPVVISDETRSSPKDSEKD